MNTGVTESHRSAEESARQVIADARKLREVHQALKDARERVYQEDPRRGFKRGGHGWSPERRVQMDLIVELMEIVER